MSVVSSLYTGAAGLNSHGEALSVVGDNIANVNTIGYKLSRANFEDVLAQSVGGGNETGLGSRIADVQKILTQGALLGTGVATDLAIKGDGFFAVKGSAAGLDGTFYTRAGQFHLDKDGYMVNADDLKAQGYTVNAQGVLVKSLTDIQLSNAPIPPVATTQATIAGNLDSTSAPMDAVTNPWDLTNPEGTSNFSTSMTVYDSLGDSHSVTVFYRNDSATGWNYYALADGAEVTGGTPGTWSQIGTGTMTFDTSGNLTAGGTGTIATTFNGAAAQTITVDLTQVTGYASKSTVTYLDQNGYGSGSLSGISINSEGTITGIFSNGQQRTVGQVLLADFKAADQMSRIGSNLYIETEASGTALLGEAASGGRGTISAGSLEQSNVDLAQQFVDMIAFQRGFQSNSKTIQTADQMLQELINLKR